MQQKITKSKVGLLAASADAIAGDIKNTATVTLAYNTAAALTLTRNAAETAMNNYGAGLTAQRNLRRDLDLKFGEARIVSTLSRDVLKPKLGLQFNPDWVETGFLSSLEIPRSNPKLETLLGSLADYFVANPANEANSSGVTAAALGLLHTDFSGLRQDLKSQTTNVRTRSRLQREKFAALRFQLSAMVKELSQKLSPLDERWLDYGFKIPGVKQKPTTPAKLAAIVRGNEVALKWNQSARAEYYRIWKRVVGVDQDMVAVGTAADLNFTLENLPANVTVEVGVSAVNNGGESALSELLVLLIA